MDEPFSADRCVQTTCTQPQNVSARRVVNGRTEMNARFYGAPPFNIGTFVVGREGRKAKHEQWVTMGLGNLTQIKKELSKA